MSRKLFSQSVFLVLLLAITSNTYSYDNKRKGFILGLGTGPGLTSISSPHSDYRTTNAGLITDFKIGYAPTNQLLLYWMSKVAWHSVKSTFVIRGVAGLGASYYFKEQGPSPFLIGGAGYSSNGAPFESDIKPIYGVGIAAGVGYEFVKHWSVESNFTWGNPGNRWSRANVLGLKLTINWLGY